MLRIRKNVFTVRVRGRAVKFINMCPINSLIHAFMHMHANGHNLGRLDRNNEFYQLIISLFGGSFEEGNTRIAEFILERELYSSRTTKEVNCFEHIELIIERCQLPLSANLYCHICNANKDIP